MKESNTPTCESQQLRDGEKLQRNLTPELLEKWQKIKEQMIERLKANRREEQELDRLFDK